MRHLTNYPGTSFTHHYDVKNLVCSREFRDFSSSNNPRYDIFIRQKSTLLPHFKKTIHYDFLRLKNN